jgi:DNA-directed RNA polymerase subunit H
LSEKKTIDLFNHALVPRHVILSEEETAELIKKFRIKLYQMPHVKSSDPAARVIGAKPGSVLKVIRNSQTAGEAVSYRFVIE